jgi:shikimate kinase
VAEAPNIVLVGPMGSGKSAAGRELARRLGRPFIDLDALIEEREGKPIPRIFAEHGEPYFRGRESALCREVSSRGGQVIAAGGGVVIDPDNLRALSAAGRIFCLRASAETILARVGHETHRPLLQGGDKREKIQSLLDQRRPLYDAIPDQVPTDGETAAQTASRILQLLRTDG